VFNNITIKGLTFSGGILVTTFQNLEILL